MGFSQTFNIDGARTSGKIPMRKLTSARHHTPRQVGVQHSAAPSYRPIERRRRLAFVRRGQCSPASARMSISCTSRSPILIFEVCTGASKGLNTVPVTVTREKWNRTPSPRAVN
jgi:hypothetical protein